MTDITRAGAREYTAEEYERVVGYVQGMGGMVGNDELAHRLNLGGRTIRAILSDADGVEFVLRVGDSGIALARTADEADAGTARIASQARRMNERADRRRLWAEDHLVRVQQRMFS